ncbi:MAG: T9SS type A sorting domain-containing protein [Bacteroidota bacterium]
MKKYLLLFFILILNSTITKGQITFQRFINDPDQGSGFGITDLPDSSILLFTSSNLLIKTDSTGALLWTKKIMAGGLTDLWNPKCFFRTSDGNIVLLGYYSFNSNYNTTSTSIVKLDTAGNILWTKSYFSTYANSIKETRDHGFIISATTLQDTLIGISYFRKIVMKIDSIGNLLWSKLYSTDSLAFGGSEIVEDVNGGYLFCGEGYNTMICKLDSTGNIQRSYFSSSLDDYQLRVLIAVNSNTYLVLFLKTILCLDSSANIKWYKEAQGSYEEFHDAMRLNDSTIIITGRTNNIDLRANLMRIDTLGNILQQECYHNFSGDFSRSLAISSYNKGFLLTGQSTNTMWQFSRPFLIRTDENGYLDCEHFSGNSTNFTMIDTMISFSRISETVNPNLTLDTILSIPVSIQADLECLTITSLSTNIDSVSQILISPNPTSASIDISVSNHSLIHEFEIFNLLGEKVGHHQFINSNNENTIDVSHLNPGVYFVKLQTEKGSAVQKLMIQ